MNKVTSISIAVVCALGMSAAMAQSVQRGTSVQGAAATTKTPVLVAQAGAAAGGASTGASTGGVLAGVGTAGSVGSTIVFVGAAAAGLVATKSTAKH